MPPLAIAKGRIGEKLGSSATKSEGQQNMLCAYLSAALLVGLGANALFGLWWADPVTALVIAGVAIKEGRESWRGESCCTAPSRGGGGTPRGRLRLRRRLLRLGGRVKPYKPTFGPWWLLWMVLGMLFFFAVVH